MSKNKRNYVIGYLMVFGPIIPGWLVNFPENLLAIPFLVSCQVVGLAIIKAQDKTNEA